MGDSPLFARTVRLAIVTAWKKHTKITVLFREHLRLVGNCSENSAVMMSCAFQPTLNLRRLS